MTRYFHPAVVLAALSSITPHALANKNVGHGNLRQTRRQLASGSGASSSLWDLLQDVSSYAEEDKTVASPTTENKVNIIKPPLDTSEYEFLTLDNKLRVVLCSDPESSVAAAAMDVHVGATSDPDDVPGLAHFNEHMLFLGTEKYPDENSFAAFLSTNSGSTNAYTDSEDTVYFFSMERTNFKEGLDRFGSFFSGPLFDKNSTDRELNAIESENAKNLQNDGFRAFQLQKGRANSLHPFSKFYTGNRYTLKDQINEKNLDLHEQLLQFYDKHYSANQMTLAVVGPQSLDELKKYVMEGFKDIPNKDVSKPEEQWKGKIIPFGKDVESLIPSIGHTLIMVPVRDVREISVMWPIVYSKEGMTEDDFRWDEPSKYLSHVLGHEGEKSLLSHLKKQGWANGLEASGRAALSDFATFSLSVSLTDAGLKQIDDVVESIFSAIKMASNEENPIPDHIFDETFALSELKWRYRKKGDAPDYATSLATAMHHYEPELVVAGPRRMGMRIEGDQFVDSATPRTAYSSDKQRESAKSSVSKLLKYLTVDNAMITVASKSFAGKTSEKEFWYKTDYSTTPIPSLLAETLSQPRMTNDIAFNIPNKFIPSEEGLKVLKDVKKATGPMALEERMQVITPPKKIQDDEKWTAYFKQDDRFGEPKAVVKILIEREGLADSPEDAIHGMLYELSADDHLKEYTYSASLAGLGYDIDLGRRGIELGFGGYSEKLPEFTSSVVSKLVNDVSSTLPQDQNEFNRYMDTLRRGLYAFDVKQPYEHSLYYANLATAPLDQGYDNSELRSALDEVTLDSLKAYASTLFSQGKGIFLAQGNLEETAARNFLSTLSSTLDLQVSDKIPPLPRVLPLPTHKPTRLTISSPNPQNGNSATVLSYQSLAEDPKSHVCMTLLSHITKEPYFDDLRTKQQLGYIVTSGSKIVDHTSKLLFIAQSSVAPVETLTEKTLAFTDTIQSEHLDTLSDDEFEALKTAMFLKSTDRDKTMGEEMTRNWYEINTGELQFDRKQRTVKALLDLKKEDVLAFWKELSSESDRLIITEIVPSIGDAASNSVPSKSYNFSDLGMEHVMEDADVLRIGIDDIIAFRKSLDVPVGAQK